MRRSCARTCLQCGCGWRSWGHGQSEWRVQVQYVFSGESRYFREWAELVGFLQAILPKIVSDEEVVKFN
ncbi:MAG: hypothetical protein L6R45_00880 [Anaerolineae bacterium]|nr:hypothetical protein [Anaerolineae bacterium]